jgi:photoactive yellow protein
MASQSASFDAPDLARRIESLSREEIDALPFGVIGIAADGTVRLYNATEARQSGFGGRPALGQTFFTDIAPCMNTPVFRGRIEQAMAAGTLEMTMTHIGDFADRRRELLVRVQSAHDGGLWMFILRGGG